MRAEIYGCFAEELPPYDGTLTLIYSREREKGEKEREREMRAGGGRRGERRESHTEA